MESVDFKEMNDGYIMKPTLRQTKRYCQTLQLREDDELIRQYISAHSREHHWPEISEGIRQIGIIDMQIFIHGNILFMIVDTPLDFNWDEAFARLATMPRQQEWEEYVGRFQNAAPGATSDQKWQLMRRIFHIYD